MTFPVLALMVALPTLAAIAIGLIPKRRSELVYPLALTLRFLPLAIVGYALWEFEVGVPGYQFSQQVLWYEPWGVSWNVGVDGISLLLLALTAVLFPVSIAASKSIDKNQKMYMVAMLLLETGMLGVFVALRFGSFAHL